MSSKVKGFIYFKQGSSLKKVTILNTLLIYIKNLYFLLFKEISKIILFDLFCRKKVFSQSVVD